MIGRVLENTLRSKWDSGKVMIILGPRQVGKTTLLEKLCEEKGSYLRINGDDPEHRNLLENAGERKLRRVVGKAGTLFIDEAQRIPDIGLTVKILHDRIPEKRVILSGSSSLELADNMKEPLTGRKWEYRLFPLSWQEYVDHVGYLQANAELSGRLVLGMYPEVITASEGPEEVLKSLAGSYLYKDLLHYKGIRKPELLEKLLTALALQVGSEVNFNELAGMLRVDRNTVEQYISLLEKAFVVFRLPPLSRNLRNELNKGRKVYFYDNGIRNALLGDFRSLEMRTDKGALWENFLVSERLKRNVYAAWHGRSYFWRTYQQQEVDYVEEVDGDIRAFEFKWSSQRSGHFPKTFLKAYEPVIHEVVTPSDMDGFLLEG